jgi:hypothetical protein
MIRAAAALLFAAALTLLAGTGCQRSGEVTNPKGELKDKGPLQPVPPAGVPGTKLKKGPTTGSE